MICPISVLPQYCIHTLGMVKYHYILFAICLWYSHFIQYFVSFLSYDFVSIVFYCSQHHSFFQKIFIKSLLCANYGAVYQIIIEWKYTDSAILCSMVSRMHVCARAGTHTHTIHYQYLMYLRGARVLWNV